MLRMQSRPSCAHVPTRPSSSSIWRKLALLSATCWLTAPWIACTRTVKEPVEVRVPVPVEIRSLCPLLLPALPERPERADSARCAATFGAGAICYDAAGAVRLAALLDVLVGLYVDRAACETR